MFSGGKDSLACVYLLRDHLDRITIYHLDTGDLLPEIRASVAHVEAMAPHFVRVQTDAMGWIEQNGLPTDLLPHGSHQVGQMMGEGPQLVTRYYCCFSNLMLPLWTRIKEDGNTLAIRGTKAVDMVKLPVDSGEMANGIELWLPIRDWSHAEVFAYLKAVGAPANRIYDYVTNSPECARCSAWWGERRARYLRQFHPDLYVEYERRLRIVAAAAADSIAHLNSELAAMNEVLA